MSRLELSLQMNFYITLLCFTYTISFSNQKSNPHLRVANKGVQPITPNSVGLIFFVDVNNTSNVDYDAELVPDRCCLEQGLEKDCDVLEIVGGCVQTIPKSEIATLKLVVPIIDLYERNGRCSVYLDTKDIDNKRSAMRNNIDIPFDTRVSNASVRDIPKYIKVCKRTDQDPTNDCNPVDCKTFYNDKKPYYSNRHKRCINAPSCISGHTEIPTSIYDPIQNKCKENAITKEDVEYVKHKLLGKSRIGKDLVIIKKFKDRPDLVDVYNNKIKTFARSNKHKTKVESMISYLKTSKWGMIGLIAVTFTQCLFIIGLISCALKNCRHCKKQKVIESKYINAYRQEASVTTPLMGLTNETDTTRQFQSDSTNIDKKINCYKACQKEKQKTCLSDDILAKCVNRRNWNSRSDSIKKSQETKSFYNTLYCENSKTSVVIEDEKPKYKKSIQISKATPRNKEDRGKGDSTVNIKKSNKKNDSDEKKSSYSPQKRQKVAKGDSKYLSLSSEKEIKCHSFNSFVVPSSDTDLKRTDYEYSTSKTDVKNISYTNPNYTYDDESSYSNSDAKRVSEEIECHTYNYNTSKSGRSKDESESVSVVKLNKASFRKARSNLNKMGDGDAPKEQASVQASFSNDSIDDFLSERGLLFMTGENISKYSFSDQSLHTKALSSRTSKNNLLRNMFSFLRREKQGPSSEPAKSTLHDSVNLELIHMSRATMYSSSNNDDCFKTAAGPKLSTTSL